MTTERRILWVSIGAMLFYFFGAQALAESRIAILDFELKDLTPQPRSGDAKQRAASIKPMLEETLKVKGGYHLIDINSDAQAEADKGFGYLFDHHDLVAELGQQFGADFVLMGRVHKATHLFVYFMAHLVDVRTQKLIGNYIVEVKGSHQKLTLKGVESLVAKIDGTLRPLASSPN